MSNKLQLHPKLTECKQCKSYNHSSTHHPTYKHCRVIQCSICGTHWYACIEHNKRFNIANQNKLHSHFVNEHSLPYIQHSMNSSNYSDNTTNIEFTTFNADDDDDDDDFDNMHTFKKLRSEQISNDSTINSTNYNVNIDTLLNDVIGTAFTNNQYSTKSVSKDEIAFHLNLTNLCNTITESQQVQLIDIIYQLMSTKFDTTQLPITYKDLQKFYLTGRHSIYQNIPCPIIIEFDNHACVPLKEVIKHSLITLTTDHFLRLICMSM